MKSDSKATDDALTKLAKTLIQRQETKELYWLDHPVIRSMIRCKLGYIEDAMVDIDLAIQKTPDKSFLYEYRGSYYADNQQYQKALEDFSIVIQIDPDNSEIYLNRGHIFRVLDRYSEAIADYTQAITLEDSLLDAYFFRGVCYKQLGEKENAVADIQTVLSIDPEFAPKMNCQAIFP